ncbi:ABC transporter permease [Denitrobaculum tricleocarpae]|uniref:MlaE family lipid ABC transporter permease subunit n=1 Tax=Denitrobaculum tricleocarpae TaxID=2591009 RepID=A0A545TMD2_9PROT|nr:MlaE family lipid ABC transporter permease subunit [Denitrobaculum tricleocarpae]TQV78301.1 MlaE family lipid ABC transporter permease subunit [Denitrobaculum tricleocarpae]
MALADVEVPTADQCSFTVKTAERQLTVSFEGAWTIRTVGQVSRDLRKLKAKGLETARFDLAEIESLDTAGAWVIIRTAAELKAAGLSVEYHRASQTTETIMRTVSENHIECPPEPSRGNALVQVLEHLGHETYLFCKAGRDLLNFLGYTVIVLVRSILNPRRIRFVALVSQMEQTGFNALPIVGLISFLIGVVLAFQGADQLARFGAQIYTVNLVAVGILREMGILLTAIIVAGRSGSAFTAQIGMMKVNEEIDAMETIGLDPMDVLVMPRVIGLFLVMPLLTFYADVMGLLGGAIMAMATLDISLAQFTSQLLSVPRLNDFLVGMIKAPFFAIIISIVGCYEGLRVARSAESVGKQTTRSVVEAIFLVIVLDALFSVIFSIIGI